MKKLNYILFLILIIKCSTSLAQSALGLRFDGVDDRATIPYNAAYSLNGTSTFEAWIKVDSIQPNAESTIFSNREAGNPNTGIQMLLINGKIAARVGGVVTPTFGNDLRDGLCHHFSMSRYNTGGYLYFYVDGNTAGTYTGSSQSMTTTHAVWIGADEPTLSTSRLKGVVHELRFWNIFIGSGIGANRYNYLYGNESGLIGYWRLNDAAGTQILDDLSSTNNDGYRGTTNAAETSDPSSVASCMCSTTASITSGAGTVICNAAGLTLSATTGAGLTYQWLKNGSVIAGAASSTYAALTAGTYTCKILNGSCGNTSNAIVLTATNPVVSISYPNNLYICSGSSLTFSSNVTNGGTASYQWKLNGNNIAGATSATYAATQAGTYSLLVTNTTNGCSALSGNTATLNVFAAAPVASINFPYGATGCGSVKMQVGAGAVPGYTYQWQSNGANVNGGGSYTYYTNSNGAYTCIVTNACGTSTSNILNPDVIGTGFITYSGNTNLCSGSLTLTAPSFNLADYQWKNNGFDIIGANSNVYTATGAGNYSCLIGSKSCGAMSTFNVVAVDGKPSIVSETPLEFCTGGVVLHAYGDSSATAYQWSLNGSAINGATSNTYTATGSGTYACTVTSAACGAQNSNSLTVTSGVTPQISLFGFGASGTPIDICTISPKATVYFSPANAGTYTLKDVYGTYTMSPQGQNYFTDIGSGTYVVSLDNACGSTQSSTFSVRDTWFSLSVTSSSGTSFCSNGSLPTLYLRSQNNVPGGGYFSVNSPAWVTHNWKLNGVSIPGGTQSTIVPTQTGWYTCAVTNTCGSAMFVDSLFITVSQMPSSATITANGPLSFCQGQSVTFTANVVPGATYNWYRNGSLYQSSTSNTCSPTISGTYKVSIVNGACAAVTSSDQVVTVTTLPAQYITVSSPTILCSPGSVTLTAPPGNTYEWYSSNTTGIIGTSSTFTATTSSNYYAKVYNAQGCSFNTYQQVVSIANPCIITTGYNSSNCENGTVRLESNYIGNPQSYQWKKNGVAISGAIFSSYFFAGGAAGIGAYTVDVIADCGIVGSNTYNYSTYIPFSATCTPSGNASACTPATVTLNASAGTNLNYEWYKDDNYIGYFNNPTYVANATGKYGVYIYDAVTGCNVNTNTVSPTYVNYGNLAPSISPATGPYFCSSVTLTANSGTGLSYQWKNNGVNISGATSQSYTAATSGTYSVVITNSCGSATASKTVVVAPGILSGLSISNTYPNPQCSNNYTMLTISPAQANGTVTYQWKLNGVNIANATRTYCDTYTVGGNYTCEVTNGCGTTTTAAYNVIYNSVPVPTLSASGSTNLCNGASVTLNTVTGTGYTYQWASNGYPIAGATTSSYTTAAGGTYRCKTTDANGCSVTSAFLNVFMGTGTTPTANITPSGTVNICTGATQTLTANTGSGFTYQWKNNGSNIAGATGISYNVNTAGTYTVQVTSSCGSATSAVTTVNINAATATITPAGSTTVCSGSVVLNANTGTGLTYQWKNNGTNISGAAAASYTAITSGSYTVVVTATGGCSATSAATVVSIGALTAAITPIGTVAVCTGISTTLSASAGTGYTYKWYRNNVLLSTTTQTFTTATQGTYKCVVTSGSCTATTNSVVVNVVANPSATVTYTSPLAFCSPGSVVLTANALSGATYQWEKNSATIAGATAQTYTATAAGAYRVKETKSGCSGYSSAKTVTAATSVTAAISTTDPTTLCAGGTVNMSVTSAVPGYSYQWKNNNTNISGATGTTYAASASGSYTVTATASCGTGTSNAIVVNVGSLTAQVTPSGNATVCTGGSITLSANTGSGFTYQWKNNGVNIAGATASTYAVTTAGSYTVAMTSPCGNATSAATVVTQTTVTAAITPAGTTTVCSGTSQTFTSNTGPGYTYKWYRNNVLLTSTGQTFTTATAGSYKVEVSISGSCAVQSNTATLTVIVITPTITAGGPTTFCAGQSVTFTANALSGATYQWQKSSVNIAGATAQTYTATTAGSYCVQETKSICSKYSSAKTVTVNCRLGINGEEINDEEAGSTITMEVYPNPFADKLNVSITSPTTEQTEIRIMDVLGKVQYTQQITTNSATELNTQLPAGVYMITTNIDGQVRTQTVVKTK